MTFEEQLYDLISDAVMLGSWNADAGDMRCVEAQKNKIIACYKILEDALKNMVESYQYSVVRITLRY